ncbi:hypothetical protein KIH74_09315 [Kineosporia sp. J2-2]|uniref:Uncharacterized protein n=1 Tax=Kineosporia corallincola TaxID=2835133 RepID=A0ABS5TDF5_9ACTN|nr:hypothetical protein [Kineosporia corallincola]MBT0769117.1 hypothetical protein [Kineosporia corallincola]
MGNGTDRSTLIAVAALGTALLTLALLVVLNLPTPVAVVLALMLVTTASGAIGALLTLLREGRRSCGRRA